MIIQVIELNIPKEPRNTEDLNHGFKLISVIEYLLIV